MFVAAYHVAKPGHEAFQFDGTDEDDENVEAGGAWACVLLPVTEVE
jgi:hypothetical protein